MLVNSLVKWFSFIVITVTFLGYALNMGQLLMYALNIIARDCELVRMVCVKSPFAFALDRIETYFL